jgi:hypothetical protein
MAWMAGHRIVDIFLADCGREDHIRDFPILPVRRNEFVEIENSISALSNRVNL